MKTQTEPPPPHRSMRDAFGPLPAMVEDLRTGAVTPVTPLDELEERYRFDPDRCRIAFRKALCEYAAEIGYSLVLIDLEEQHVLSSVPDPVADSESAEMRFAITLLKSHIPKTLLERLDWSKANTKQTRPTLTCIIMSMPAYDYAPEHGPLVGEYGQYLYDIGVFPTDGYTKDQ